MRDISVFLRKPLLGSNFKPVDSITKEDPICLSNNYIVMTRNFNQWYFGNLRINLDPIIFGIVFFPQCEEMLFDYCVPRYKCTYIFKTLCKLTHTCGTHVLDALILDHTNKIAKFLSPIYIVASHVGEDPH